MYWHKLKMNWFHFWYKIHWSFAEFYLGLEHVNLIFKSDLFWTVADNFAKSLDKSSQTWNKYMKEYQVVRQLAA